MLLCVVNTCIGGDNALQQHLDHHVKNASYLSHHIQNEMITIYGIAVKKSIIKEIKAAKYFAIIVDEAADLVRREQLSLILRFVDADR